MKEVTQKKIVVIGGGTGTAVVLSGLKKHAFSLSAVITVADSGGSTGRLRDEFGFLPVGDMRQSLAALAESDDQPWIQKLLLYRFDHGQGLEGHNLGNLLLTALQDMTGSTPQAIEIAERIFNLEGSIFPVTEENVDLVVEYEDGSSIVGEHHLNRENSGGKHITSVKLSRQAKLYSKAKAAIENADMIIIGPGDVYASLVPNLIVDGMKETLQKCQGKIVFIVNLMNSYIQTDKFKASDHVREVEKYIGRKIDHIIINSGEIPVDIKKHYESEHEYQVPDDLDRQIYNVLSDNLVGIAKTTQEPQDKLKRSLLRHNEFKLTEILCSLIED